MIGKIFSIEENFVFVKLGLDVSNQPNLINVHVVFSENDTKIVGEIVNIDKDICKIAIVGEIVNNKFVPGINKKPAFRSNVSIIQMNELELVLGSQKITDNTQTYFGLSNVYKNYRINVGINDFFSNHFSILGNTGAGKSSTTARILQNVFTAGTYVPVNARIFMFDAYGEYVQAFSKLGETSDINCNF